MAIAGINGPKPNPGPNNNGPKHSFTLPQQLIEKWGYSQATIEKLKQAIGLDQSLALGQIKKFSENFFEKFKPGNIKPGKIRPSWDPLKGKLIPIYSALTKVFDEDNWQKYAEQISQSLISISQLVHTSITSKNPELILEARIIMIYAFMKQRAELAEKQSNTEFDRLLADCIKKSVQKLTKQINDGNFDDIAAKDFLLRRLGSIAVVDAKLAPFVREIYQKYDRWLREEEKASTEDNCSTDLDAKNIYEAHVLSRQERIRQQRLLDFKSRLTTIIDPGHDQKFWDKPIRYTLNQITSAKNLVFINSAMDTKSLYCDQFSDKSRRIMLHLVKSLMDKGFTKIVLFDFFVNFIDKASIMPKLQLLDDSMTFNKLVDEMKAFFAVDQQATDLNKFLFHKIKDIRDGSLKRFFNLIDQLKQIQMEAKTTPEILLINIPPNQVFDVKQMQQIQKFSGKKVLIGLENPLEFKAKDTQQINLKNHYPDYFADPDDPENYDIFAATAHEIAETRQDSGRQTVALDFDQVKLRDFTNEYSEAGLLEHNDIESQGYGNGITLLTLPPNDGEDMGRTFNEVDDPVLVGA